MLTSDALGQMAGPDLELTSLSTIRDMISKRRSEATWLHFRHQLQPVRLQVDSSLNRFACSADWKRRPGRPRAQRVDEWCQDKQSPANLWRSAIRIESWPFWSELYAPR